MDFYKPQAIFLCQEGEASIFQNLKKRWYLQIPAFDEVFWLGLLLQLQFAR